jgi:hypothetical protein
MASKALTPSRVRRSSSAIDSASGGVLKLKQLLPYMRFFSAGDMVPLSAWFM